LAKKATKRKSAGARSRNVTAARLERARLILQAFRSRAFRLRATAFGILGIIFLLLVGGAGAFVFAPQITLSDFYTEGEIDRRIKDIEGELAPILAARSKRAESQSAYDEQFSNIVTPAYNQYNTILRKYAPERKRGSSRSRVASVPPEAAIGRPSVTIGESNIDHPEAVASQLATLDKGNDPGVWIAVSNSKRSSPSYYFVPWEKLPQLKNEIDSVKIAPLVLPVPPQIEDETKEITQRADLLQSAVDQLRGEKTARALAAMVGHKAEPKSDSPSGDVAKTTSDVPLAQILQTNVTRFGTIIMITFLVSILTPLYRYNIRLATYYDARADVLDLLNTKLESVGFVELAAALTPAYDFGKAPATPIEQIIELARQLADKSKPHTKSE